MPSLSGKVAKFKIHRRERKGKRMQMLFLIVCLLFHTLFASFFPFFLCGPLVVFGTNKKGEIHIDTHTNRETENTGGFPHTIRKTPSFHNIILIFLRLPVFSYDTQMCTHTHTQTAPAPCIADCRGRREQGGGGGGGGGVTNSFGKVFYSVFIFQSSKYHRISLHTSLSK